MNSQNNNNKDKSLIEDTSGEEHESKVEKQGKTFFILGVIFAVFIFVATWGVFFFWFNS